MRSRPHGSAEQAARALAKAAQVLESFALLVTWKPGKTEAMLALRGKGAAAEATHLKRVEGVTYLPLEGIQGHGLRIVSHYNHLGIVSEKSSSMRLEATRRSNAATAVYMPVARTVCRNQSIVSSTRQKLAGSLVFCPIVWSGDMAAADCSSCLEGQSSVHAGAADACGEFPRYSSRCV